MIRIADYGSRLGGRPLRVRLRTCVRPTPRLLLAPDASFAAASNYGRVASGVHLMYSETPLVAKVITFLRQERLLTEVTPKDERIHSLWYVLQDGAGFRPRFRFKGTLVPFSADLADVLREYVEEPERWDNKAQRLELGAEREHALCRLRELSRAPEDFNGDDGRWLRVLADF